MKTFGYLAALALLLVSCSETKSTSPIIDEEQSSSSISVIPEMSSSSNNQTLSSGGSTTTTSSSSTISTNPSSSSKLPPISLVARTPGATGLAKTLNVIGNMNELPYDVELDTIMGTAEFLFGIKNNSSSDITGLKFEFDLDYFKVTPDSIITLGAVSSATGIDPLIKVIVEHGTMASGLGFANVLTGNQYGKLTISGKNADGDFSVSYNMHVYAKRMIIHINHTDSTKDAWSVRAPTSSIGTRHAYVDPSSDDCYLNMGSITLDTSSNINMRNMAMYYTTFYARSDINELYPSYGYTYTDTVVHNKFINELNAAKLLETSTAKKDYNCVVLVNDNLPLSGLTTSTTWSEVITTQYILD